MQAVGERYIQQRDPLSAVLLYEGALQELGTLIPAEHPAVARMQRQAAELVRALETSSGLGVVGSGMGAFAV